MHNSCLYGSQVLRGLGAPLGLLWQFGPILNPVLPIVGRSKTQTNKRQPYKGDSDGHSHLVEALFYGHGASISVNVGNMSGTLVRRIPRDQ